MDFKEGEILALYKPYTWTSFHLVNKVRYHLSKRFKVKRFKVGHAGTLDPLATGVLIICTGKATKRIEELQHHTKEYEADLMLGATTPSYDKEHLVDATYPYEHITEEMFVETLKQFTGTIAQRPPLYSACKVDGERAYNLARQGSEMELAPKQVTIEEIELLSFAPPQATIRVVCGKGTYIRSLARDIGEALGSGAYLTRLTRTRVGEHKIEDCIKPEDFAEWLDKQITE
ncbi:MAG: tRNA pseudouridine(55) synthase TruB [Bacteroidaceae bacterium]|nr:tRNA pseudouridine(55) synthase TruB [Bacteroidaceae bacterium]